jgi:hypothetical protein
MADQTEPIVTTTVTHPVADVTAPTSPPAPVTASPAAKQATWMENAPFVLVMTTVVGLFTLLGVLCYHEVPVNNEKLIDIMIGLIGGSGFTQGMQYFFGSSSSSKTKDTTTANLTSALAAAVPTPDKTVTTTTATATTAVPIVGIKPTA